MPVLTNFAGTTVIGFQRPNGTIFTLAEIQNEGYTPDNALASVPSDDRRTTHHLVQRYRRQSLPITRPATGNPTLPFDDVRLEWREVPSSTPIHLHDLDRNERVSPADGWTTAGGGHTIPLSHLRPGTSYRVDFHVLNEFNQGLVGSRTFRMEQVTRKKVFIDPGHGGTDPGAQGNGMDEKDINLDVSLRLEQLLLARGFEVLMSRREDVSLGINPRWQAANSWGADLFISVHTNSAGGTGVETIIPTESPIGSNRDLQANRRFAQIISNAIGTTFGLEVRRDNGVMLETETRHGSVGVLRHTRMIAIVPELAFIDAPADSIDVDVLRNRRQEIAVALVNGLQAFLDS